jgi:hypothetical protein
MIDLLDDLAKNVRMSADVGGTSNKPIAKWIEIATIRIICQQEKINQLETVLHDVIQQFEE